MMIEKIVKKKIYKSQTRSEKTWSTGSAAHPMKGSQPSNICAGKSMEVQPDFKDVLVLFNKHEIEYINISTSISRVSWEQANAGRVAGHYGDVPVHYLGRSDYVANKKATARHRDLADLEALNEK